MAEKTDADLVNMIRELGDTDAYGVLIQRYQGHAYGLAYAIFGDWMEAQDMAQEAFIRAYVNLHTLQQPEKFPAWLRRIVFTTCMMRLRKHRPELYESMGKPDDVDQLDTLPDLKTTTPLDQTIDNELSAVVLEAIAELPAKYRIPLTMFHLDGLSYKKVADFLEIPIGTVKSLIDRAKKRLKPALEIYAQEVLPMVKEAFDEHKPTEELASKVLKNIAELGYQKSGLCTFCGSVVGCMNFMKNDVSYDYVMGISGSAFMLLWYEDWCSSNNTLLVLGEDPIKQTFGALGYTYELVDPWEKGYGSEGTRTLFRERVIESIKNNRPVIAEGIVGPPEPGIITGFEQNGDTVLGRSYFHDGSKGYYKKDDWYKNCTLLILIGDNKGAPEKVEILKSALEWAIRLARTEVWYRGDGAKYFCGLAAYDAWSEDLKKDENFPEGDLESLTVRLRVNTRATLSGLREARNSAANFLRDMAEGKIDTLLDAAAAYDEEVWILSDMLKIAPFPDSRKTERLRMLKPDFRAKLAEMILQAKVKDEKAVELLGHALADL